MNRVSGQIFKKIKPKNIKPKNIVNIETLPLLDKKKVKSELKAVQMKELDGKLKLSYKDEWFDSMIHDTRERDLFLL